MKTCELNTFEASFTETAYWLAYFIFPIPIAMFMKRYSYKAGIIFGLVLAAIGGLLFFPAAILKEYWGLPLYLLYYRYGNVLSGDGCQSVCDGFRSPRNSSPPIESGAVFQWTRSFYRCHVLSKLILSGTHYTRETLPVDYPGGWQAYIQLETDAMKLPYLILAILLIAIAVVFVFSKLPKIGDEGETASSDKTTSSGKTKEGSQKEKLIDFGVLKHSHLRWGVIAQFFYNGGQTAINSLFPGLLLHLCRIAGRYGDYLLRIVYARISFGALDRYRIDGEIPSTGYATGLRLDEYSFVRGSDDMGRYDRVIRNVGYLFLYVYNVSHAVLIGAKRTGESDKERFGISGNGYCRQCLPATVDGLFHACQ